jgi:hypothetical protein
LRKAFDNGGPLIGKLALVGQKNNFVLETLLG